jgi:hypothetical protein
VGERPAQAGGEGCAGRISARAAPPPRVSDAMGNGVVANEGCYHDQEHINESCPTKVLAGLVPAAARAPACNSCKGARGPGLGAWPGIVPGAVHGRLAQAHPVAAGPGRDGQLHGHGAGGTGRAVCPWRLSPGPRLGCGPDFCRRPWVTHQPGGSVLSRDAPPGRRWPAPPPSRQRATPVLTRQRMNDHNIEPVP